MDAHDLLVMMGLVIAVSIGTQVIAEHLKIPAIVPLLGVGVLVGPEMLHLVDPEALGAGLRVIIPMMVAIIVFEGGMALDLSYLRQVSQVVRNLVTIGCMVTTLLAAGAAWLFLRLDWPLALLFGALVCVTGPTVINPLMRRAAVTQKLKTILMAEGVLIDAVGAVLAVVVLEALIAQQAPLEGFTDWIVRVGGGALIGIGGGLMLGMGLRYVGQTTNSELTRLSALGGALAIFAFAETIAAEAGIAAAAVAGIVIGNVRFPHEDEVHNFKGDLTQLGIGVIFVLLAARLRFADLAQIGWGGIATVMTLILVVRPICVWVSTFQTSLQWREKLFIAAVGPRGIVSASFATFAVLRLEDAQHAGSDALVGLVFMVIIGTVVVQSFTTSWIARLLGVQPMLTVIVGADPLGRDLALHLQNKGEEVILVDRESEGIATARELGLSVLIGDVTQEQILRKANLERARGLVATTPSDRTNLLVCQLARTRFNVKELVARVNDASNVKMFNDLGIRAMSPNAVAVMALDNLLRRPSTLRLLTDLDSGKEVREAELHNGSLVGKPLKNLTLEGDVLIAIIRRQDKLFVPHGKTMLAVGDKLTLIGDSDAVTNAADLFEHYVRVEIPPAASVASKLES